MDVESIAQKYPLHWLVWNNLHQELKEKLKNESVNTIVVFIFFLFEVSFFRDNKKCLPHVFQAVQFGR